MIKIPKSVLPGTLLLSFVLWVSISPSLASAAEKPGKSKPGRKPAASQLSLEELFPEKSLFSPSAKGAAFSNDGRYAAYLYRPHEERRHGSDLWIYDFKESESQRITNIEMMSKFQRSARVVIDDRIAKHKNSNPGDQEGQGGDEKQTDAKKSGKGTKKKDDQKKRKTAEEKQAEREVYLNVGEDDADRLNFCPTDPVTPFDATTRRRGDADQVR